MPVTIFPSTGGGITNIVDADDWPPDVEPDELSYLDDLDVNIRSQFDVFETDIGDLQDDVGDLQTGKADVPTGTPTGSKYLRDDNSWQTVTATDSTKVAKTGDTMTNHLLFSTTAVIPASFGIGNNSGFGLCLFAPTGWYVSTFVNQSEKLRVTDSAVQANVKLEFNSAADPPTHGIGPNGSGNLVVNGSGNLKLRRNGVDHFECYGGLLLAYYSIQYHTSATPTSTAYEDGYNSTIGAYKNAPAAGSARICTAGGGTTKSEVVVHGASHSTKAGAVDIKAEGVTRTNNGTWTAIYSLAAGVHTGEFVLLAYRATGDFHAVNVVWEVEGTTLNGPYNPNGSSEWDWGFVAEGSAATNNISLRISGGNVQINVGTSVESDIKFGLIFRGMVN